jgi:hypothetical protein
LQAVVQAVAQQLPHVAGMVPDPGQALDHGGDAGQGPVVGGEAVRAGTLAQRLIDTVELLVGQARGLPGGLALRSAFRPPACQLACQDKADEGHQNKEAVDDSYESVGTSTPAAAR